MTPATQTRKDFLSVLDFDAADLEHCLQLAAQLKADRSLGRHAPTADALNGGHVAMLFHKPSLRTFSTFEIAIRELGGHLVTLTPDVALGLREPVEDVARNLERWVDAVIIRTFSQDILQQFAAATKRLHVVNALTSAPIPYSVSPPMKHRLRPQRSVSLLHGIIRIAMISRNSVIAVCTPFTSVFRS